MNEKTTLNADGHDDATHLLDKLLTEGSANEIATCAHA
jgi:hypothetical protein